MGHIVNSKEEVYQLLVERLNKNPISVIINETLMEILHKLYTTTEAMVGSKFPIYPVKLEQLAEMTKIELEELKSILDGMAKKGLVIDIPRKDTFYYILSPMVIGFFEYTFMRVRKDADMKDLARLFNKYFHDKDVIKEFTAGSIKLERTLVYESLIPIAVETEVLPYEKASEIIRKSGGGAISLCACRHKAQHLGNACDAPLEVCTTLGNAAKWIVYRGLGRPASVDKLLRILDETEKLGLVHNCDNVINNPAFICHCCGCCCVILKGINDFNSYAVHPSNFIPEVNVDECIGCGTCEEKCHINAIEIVEEIAKIDEDRCLGCGVCASVCPVNAISMTRRKELHIPPDNLQEKFLKMAKERGKI